MAKQHDVIDAAKCLKARICKFGALKDDWTFDEDARPLFPGYRPGKRIIDVLSAAIEHVRCGRLDEAMTALTEANRKLTISAEQYFRHAPEFVENHVRVAIGFCQEYPDLVGRINNLHVQFKTFQPHVREGAMDLAKASEVYWDLWDVILSVPEQVARRKAAKAVEMAKAKREEELRRAAEESAKTKAKHAEMADELEGLFAGLAQVVR